VALSFCLISINFLDLQRLDVVRRVNCAVLCLWFFVRLEAIIGHFHCLKDTYIGNKISIFYSVMIFIALFLKFGNISYFVL
jgi:hypothetical protein